MSRYLLAIGVCAALATSAAAAPTVTITTADSTAQSDPANAALVKEELATRLAKTPCTGCHVDAAITKLVVGACGNETSVTAKINITISDDRGVMISVLSGGARAVVPNATLRPGRLASLRAEALTGAIDGMSTKVALALRPIHAHAPDAWLVTLVHGWFVAPLPVS